MIYYVVTCATEQQGNQVSVRPHNIETDVQLLERIADAIRIADVQRAAQAAETASRRGVTHPLIHMARALSLSAANRQLEALEEFLRVERMSATTPALKSAIGVCLTKLERYSEAVEAFDAAIEMQPMAAQFHTRKGWSLELSGQLVAATRAHERAVELKPDFAEALGRLAYLASRRGDLKEARRYAEQALKFDVQQVTAQLALATVEIEEHAYDAADLRLSRLLTNTTVVGNDRYVGLGLLGDIRDRQGQIADAFAFYEMMNDVERAPSTTKGGLAEAVNSFRRYMETSPLPGSRRMAPQLDPAAPPHIFVLGFPRSGTTLLEQVLASHPDVVSLEERDTLQDAIQAYMGSHASFDRLWTADETELSRHRELYWRRVRAFGIETDGKAFVDKTPINTIYLPLIERLFPDARILFALRDPRDVVLSCFRRRFKSNALSQEFGTLESAATFYDGVMRLGELYRAKLTIAWRYVHHEALVDQFEYQLHELCKFLGLPWHEDMLGFAAQSQTRGVATPSSVQLARGLNTEGIGQWRHYAPQLATVTPLLAPWIRRFGYPDA